MQNNVTYVWEDESGDREKGENEYDELPRVIGESEGDCDLVVLVSLSISLGLGLVKAVHIVNQDNVHASS